MDHCDVLIVGAGPTGLMMAAELTRYGLKCRIIDQSPSPSKKSKALAIQPRTLEVFHFLGIDEEFLKKGHQVHALNIASEYHAIGRIAFNSLDSSFPYLLSLPQSETEVLLTKHLSSLGIKVEREIELVKVRETDEQVIADIQNSGNNAQISAKWVIGCDGAHSFVRKHLDLSFKGKSFPIVFSLADVQLDWKYAHEEVFAFWSPEGVLAAIPLPQKGYYRLIFVLDRCQKQQQKITEDNLQVEISAPSLEEVKQVVWKRADPKATLSKPQWIANFHVNSRLASHFRKGRFFLAGDAVHIHSPIGGQGMNTGLQDAFNLAWKMGLVHQNKMSPKILDSYHEERQELAIHLLQGTEAGTVVAALKKSWQISLRNWIALMLLRIPFLQKKLIRAVSQISITYPQSKIIHENGKFHRGPKIGSRMPNFTLQLREETIHVHDLMINIDSFFAFILLGDATEHTEVEKILAKQKLPIKTILITKVNSSNTILIDKDAQMHHVLGVKNQGCYIIRPDTYIGYRQTPIDLQALRIYFEQYQAK